jgi:histidyl-tRNA synthetase
VAGTSDAQARAIVELGEIAGSPHEVLAALPALVEGSEVGARGVTEVGAVVEGMLANGVLASTLDVDVSTARGLDYYTGTVFETYLDALPGIGSVCSGGRYDDLASVYTKQRLPGIGASLGVDRLLAAMDELGLVEHSRTPASVLVTQFDAEHWSGDLRLATELRAAGIAVEVYPDARKLGAQLKYADRRGHRIVLIVGTRERESGVVQLKDMTKGESRDVPRSDVVAACRAILASG